MDSTCKKCLSTNNPMRYEPTGNRLAYTCARCGYTWQTSAADTELPASAGAAKQSELLRRIKDALESGDIKAKLELTAQGAPDGPMWVSAPTVSFDLAWAAPKDGPAKP